MKISKVISIFLCLLVDLTASNNQEILISHVQRSIENAQKGISQLDAAVLNIDGMSSSSIRHLLNNLCSLKGARYLEIGCWKGSTLVAATFNNETNLDSVVAIDNWVEFGGPRSEFFANVDLYIKNIPLKFIEQNCFTIDKRQIFHNPVNIYFYDGAHTIEDQIAAFTYFNSVFDDVFIAVIDDWNWERVRKGTLWAFEELGYQILYEQTFFTEGNGSKTWWNGICIVVIKK